MVATTACWARIVPRAVLTDDHTVIFAYFLDRTVAEKFHATGVTGLRNAREIFQRVESRLTRVAQHMTVFAASKRHADKTMDRRAHIAYGVHLLVDDFCRHIPALKQITVQPPEIAVDVFLPLDLLDSVDRRRLAVAKELRCLVSLDLRHLADKVVAQRRKMRGGAGRHAAGDAASVDNHHRFAALAELVGCGNSGDAGSDHRHIALRVARQRTRCRHYVNIHP